MANDQVSVEISIEEKAALRALTKLSKGIDKFENNVTTSVKKSDRAFDSFKGNLAAIATSGAISAIAGGLKDLVIGSFETAAAFEKINTQLEVLTGSQEKATALFEQLKEFSAGTPFQLQGIAEASAQLLSFGFEAESVQERIAKIGEVAAGSGSDLKEVALIYGQVAAAGKLTGERLLQLQERAIPIGSALANSLGVAESEVRELVSSGVVGFKEFEEAFNSMSQAGGIFEGAIDKQSQTINGSLSTLSDNFQILQAELGATFSKEAVDLIRAVTQGIQNLSKEVIENKDAIKTAIGFVRDYVTVYSELAAQALGTETELEKLDSQIAKLVDRQQKAKESADEARKSMGDFFGVFDSDKAFTIKQSEKNIKALEDQITSLINKRKELTSQQAAAPAVDESSTTGESPRAQRETAENTKILESRRKLFSDLLVLEQEQDALSAERELAKNELNLEKREAAITKLSEFEIQKAEIAYQAELEKNKKIRDAESKALADRSAYLRKDIAQQRAQANAENQINQARVRNRELMVQGFGNAIAQASRLAKQGTNEQKILAAASATINTYAAATRAYRDYPYPANIAVMATTIAAGLNQVSQIQKQSFATGGVVGGFSGASMGADNTVANVRTGEMVLNGSQQRKLFDIATGNQSNGNSNVMEAINNLASQPIVVEVDGREIARTVRDQRIEGFA